jgi:hypothetical protein
VPQALTGDTTFAFANPIASQTALVKVTYGASFTGGNTLDWTSVLWPGGVAPTPTAADGKVDLFGFFFDRSAILGAVVGRSY